ncbi:hypothetical protein [Oceanihabitans sediminis]|uniref:DUF4292 domain-containing protein n=1 Tax=Oceanihabitans sediminis TaxID=1812012 RepID=A0A368P6Y2_9FLAO|nr:hypothetical protein [Oceanihabitans sediminis]MDX1278646.1 hypothetical protein [Oceanihabitans sediminis]MDX1772874.1 hypothetical protein [Oceanihabitans sediminis]RBP34552.1 hypothetical protein DFR65_101446 [Oceanihabitans sediminis]RCU58216.1 hypothetical protein DU428_02215 [Oceanihabitans sediminis]
MRYLLISICFLVVSCASFPKKNNFQNTAITGDINNPYFSNTNKDYVYKANIEVYNNSFGGLLIIKKTGEQKHRIVFTTEMGNKLFDFLFEKDNFKVNYILEELDRKILIQVLKKDFQVLVTKNLKTQEAFTSNNQTVKKTTLANKNYYYFETPKLTKVIRANSRKEKVRFLFTEINDNIAEHIEIVHTNIKLKINLKSITE